MFELICMNQKRVLVFGTFDTLHAGHLFFLRSARVFGDLLTAVVARDQDVEALKSKTPIMNEQERMEAVRALSYVDDVCLSDAERGSFHVLDKVKPDIIVLGHDQHELKDALESWMNTTHRIIALASLEEVDVGSCGNCSNCSCH